MSYPVPKLLASLLLLSGSLAQAADALSWNRLEGRKGVEAAPEWRCQPDASGQDWQCEGGSADQRPPPGDLPAAAPDIPLAVDLPASLFVLKEDLAPEQAATLPGFCYGDYVLPEFPLPADTDSSRYPVVTEADHIESDLGNSVTLEGEVRFMQGNRSLRAERAFYDSAARRVDLTGGVRILEPDMVLQGEQASVQIDSRAARLHGAQFLLPAPHFRGTSEEVTRNEAGDLEARDNSFTRCEPGGDSWRLDARSLTIRHGEVFGTARDAVLRVKNVPVFYTPYIKFPVTDDRQSGFLFPNMGYSGDDGIELVVPYYLNLAPNYDATLVPRYMGERGVGLDAEFRRLSRRQEITLAGGYLPGDDIYDGEYSRDDFQKVFPGQSFHPADRWLASIDQKGRFGNIYSYVDFTAVSDRDYFRDLGSDFTSSGQIEVERRAELSYQTDWLRARLWAQDFQRLDEVRVDPYKRLPELQLDMTRRFGLVNLSVASRLSAFDRDTSDVSGLQALTGQRYHVEPRVTMPLAWPFGFLNLSAGYAATHYDLDQDSAQGGLQVSNLSPTRLIGTGAVDGGLYFERDTRAFGRTLTHTLEPRVFYLYREYDDQDQLPLFDTGELTFSYNQLFRSDRFSGLDRISDANQAAVGLTSRLLDANSGREFLRVSVGQINYFRARRVSLGGIPAKNENRGSSALVAEAEANIARYFRVGGGVVWDTYENDANESSAFIQYRRDNNHILNLGYRQRAIDDVRQSDVSLYWPLSRHYALMGRWNHDLRSKRTIEGFVGIEYNDCCWQVRVMARRFLDAPAGANLVDVQSDEGIFIQFVFKGLAGFGGKVESVLSRGVRGYYTDAQPGYVNW